jgi:hypothetical protein
MIYKVDKTASASVKEEYEPYFEDVVEFESPIELKEGEVLQGSDFAELRVRRGGMIQLLAPIGDENLTEMSYGAVPNVSSNTYVVVRR